MLEEMGVGGGMARLEEEGAHGAHLWLLLDEDLEVLVDDGDGQQNTSSRSKQKYC